MTRQLRLVVLLVAAATAGCASARSPSSSRSQAPSAPAVVLTGFEGEWITRQFVKGSNPSCLCTTRLQIEPGGKRWRFAWGEIRDPEEADAWSPLAVLAGD